MKSQAAWLTAWVVMTATVARASDEFERPPIEYSASEPNNAISTLQGELDRGEATLVRDPKLGYLPDVLAKLRISPESQMFVFSKTSLQIRRISPRTPRAVYFNDDLAVGYCQMGDVLEVSATDRQLGTVFYTLSQKEQGTPRFVRQTDNCLVCHASSRTDGVPGHLARSVFVDPTGQLVLSAGSRSVDYRTPFEQRWGGWYVTGTHGSQTHQGNLVLESDDAPPPKGLREGLNVTDLSSRFDIARYLRPHSDIVALMVFEHQNVVHNKITQANFTTRQALAYDSEMTKALGEPAGTQFDSSKRRIEAAAEELVQALLFVGESPLQEAVTGTSRFREEFEQEGPRDSKGRSLREFDLTRRLFKFPCSYLIYSESFDALPQEVRGLVIRKLAAVLTSTSPVKGYEHLSSSDRQAIWSILTETKSHDFPLDAAQTSVGTH